MGVHELWRLEPSTVLSAKVGGLPLKVGGAGGGPRFLVHEHLSETGAQPPVFLAASASADVRGAISAAEREAATLATAHVPEQEPHPSQVPSAGEIDLVLVEDNVLVRACLAEMLGDGGLRVVEAVSAAKALEVADAASASAVLVTDLYLGLGMDGTMLIAALRERRPLMRAVLISGGEVAEGKLDPRDTFLPKPFVAGDLVRAVLAVRTSAPRPAVDSAAEDG